MNDKLSKVCSLCFEEVVIETISRFPEKKRENYSVEVNGLFEKNFKKQDQTQEKKQEKIQQEKLLKKEIVEKIKQRV